MKTVQVEKKLYLKIRTIFLMLFLFGSVQIAYNQNTIRWQWSKLGLPSIEYNGLLPANTIDKKDNDALLASDPYFLLGNYRLTLFVHASGNFQFLTGERSWVRVNASKNDFDYGSNEASITISNKNTLLTGLNSIASNPLVCRKHFGVGFARYNYTVNNILCRRVISVKPSKVINTGFPGFVITVSLINNGRKSAQLQYTEKMPVNYTSNKTSWSDETEKIIYHTDGGQNLANLAIANIKYKEVEFMSVPSSPNERFPYDIAPPVVYMFAQPNNTVTSKVSLNSDTLVTSMNVKLKAGESKTFNIVIGLNFNNDETAIRNDIAEMFKDSNSDMLDEGLFTNQWKQKLPDLSSEKDEIIRREMLWNAHALEAMATYSQYYNETFIPQGTLYSYHYGWNVSSRDHLQATLGVCYTNPALAKSSIKFVMQHTDNNGDIKREDVGNGFSPRTYNKESDAQLYMFNTVAEYLSASKDYNFLYEQVNWYPAESKLSTSVLSYLERCFVYLRDEVGVGPNGLVRLLNSDWNDGFWKKNCPDFFMKRSESHLNTAMLLAVFPKLIIELKKSEIPSAQILANQLEQYRAKIFGSYMKDFGNRKFSARAYVSNDIKYGLDNVSVEPQGYLLQIPELSNERKQEIYNYVKEKLYTPEQTGFRSIEKSIWGKGEGEDGGIWYSVEYPIVAALASFNKAEGWEMLRALSFNNFSTHFPDYWMGQWTAPDNINSSLSKRTGLYRFWRGDNQRVFQGYCCHPHAWPLFCYFKLKN